MARNQITELTVNGKAIKALEITLQMDIKMEDQFETFCDELEKLNVNEEIYDYGELFEQALLQKGIIT